MVQQPLKMQRRRRNTYISYSLGFLGEKSRILVYCSFIFIHTGRIFFYQIINRVKDTGAESFVDDAL